MDRTQFTFYESYLKAISRIKNKGQRADAYEAIAHYALYGMEPDLNALPQQVCIAFELIRPTLDTGRRKAENGKRGGSKPKQTEANGSKPKQTESEGEGEKEKE